MSSAPTTTPPGTPPGAPPTTTTAIAFTGLKMGPAALHAATRGDRRGLVSAMGVPWGVDTAALPPNVLALLDSVAEFALELRRQNVAVIGSHEAFVRHTPNGSLHQVVRPVRLSLTEGTIFQIRKKRPVCRDNAHRDQGLPCFGGAINTDTHKGSHRWEEVVIGDPNKGIVTYPGYLALNAVAGCAVGLPPTVNVDGMPKTNPYVERETTEVIRIVISVVVVGPTPATGNPVVVNYSLDYDPRKDLAHMLLNLRDNADLKNSVKLVPTRSLKDEDEWGQLGLAAGVSIRYDLSLDAVAGVFSDYVELQANALKKALTVARRNAMKSHPALGVQAVVVNGFGVASVPVVGWAGDDAAMRRWQEIQSALSRGLPLPDADVLEVSEVYDVERDNDGLDTETGRSKTQPVTPDKLTEELRQRNAHIEYIDKGIDMLETAQVIELHYDPAAMTLAELSACRAKLDSMLDSRP